MVIAIPAYLIYLPVFFTLRLEVSPLDVDGVNLLCTPLCPHTDRIREQRPHVSLTSLNSVPLWLGFFLLFGFWLGGFSCFCLFVCVCVVLLQRSCTIEHLVIVSLQW